MITLVLANSSPCAPAIFHKKGALNGAFFVISLCNFHNFFALLIFAGIYTDFDSGKIVVKLVVGLLQTFRHLPSQNPISTISSSLYIIMTSTPSSKSGALRRNCCLTIVAA